MTRNISRGDVVLSPDPYNENKYRPMVIISDEEYPFYPSGYLGLPVTSHDKSNTYEITEYDKDEIKEDLHINPSYVNPYSPAQVNEVTKYLLTLSDDFMNLMAEKVANAVGIR